jgi:deoxyribose-phosphate aldolase
MPTLAQSLDFANHHANATPQDIKQLCNDVLKYGFHAAFVNPNYVTLAVETLAGKAPVGTVISFPLGGDTKALKMAATNNAVSQGADELDVVPNIGLYLAGDTKGFMTEMQNVVESAHMLSRPVIVKFILDPGYFDKESDSKASIMRASEMVRAAGADYVKIGSGMGPRNPTLDDLAAVKEVIGNTIKIKVAGGISDRKTAETFLAAGAHHLGTSHAIQIVSEKSTSTPQTTGKSEE